MSVKKISIWAVCILVLILFAARVLARFQPDKGKQSPSAPARGSAAAVGDFYNPIADGGADPWIVKHTDGYYYLTKTTGGSITVWKSKSITGIDAGEKKVVWTPPSTGPNSKNIWAPELHWLNGKWYIYYAADGGKGTGHYMFVLESATADALGPYTSKGQITDPSNKRAIDGTVLQKNDGSLYMIWSGWEDEKDGQQNLYIAPMSNPYTISGDRVEISRPDHAWEKNGLINEGPEVLIKNSNIFVVYSASGSWTDDYCLGMLSAEMNSDVLQPLSWIKSDKPFFSKANGVYGPGHNSFTKSPDGTEDWIVYHAAKYKGGGWDRDIRAQKFTWNADGTPNFGSPLSKDAPVARPSGEPGRERYEAELALLDHAVVESQPSASGGKNVLSAKDGSGSSIEFTVHAAADGFYNMAIRFGNGTAGKNIIGAYDLTVNGGRAGSIQFANEKAWNNWSVHMMKINLHAGDNTLRFAKVMNDVEFDCIDIFP